MPMKPEDKSAVREEAANQRALIERWTEEDASRGGQYYKSEAMSGESLARVYYGEDHRKVKKEVTTEAKRKKESLKKRPDGPWNKEVLGKIRTPDEWRELRNVARKSLYWLAKKVFKKDLFARTHVPVCNMFVQKNFDGIYKKGYTLGDVHKAIDKQKRFDEFGNPTKEMLLLDPRGFFKTTLDGIDCVNWLLNVPDIRILILTAEYKLAVSFLSEIKEYFYQAEDADLTDFQLLFPEYIITGVAGTSEKPIKSPARNLHDQRGASLWVNSIDASLSGWHCDIKKGDDITTDENANSKEIRKKLKKKYDGTKFLLDQWGFADHIGTRYFPDDWYGVRLQVRADSKPVKRGQIPLSYFRRSAWDVKPGFEDVPLKELTEEMVTLNFPEKVTWQSLQDTLADDEELFRCQMMNEPAAEDKGDVFVINFSEQILRSHLYQNAAAPRDGDIFICWDWAWSANKFSDFSAGVVARVYEKPDGSQGIVILEIDYGKWKSSELALHVVLLNKKWNPKETLIEKTVNAEMLQNEIIRKGQEVGSVPHIYWQPPDLKDNAKRNRIKGLEILLNNGQLWFVMGPWIDGTFEQMNKYTGEKKNRGRKDDIPDAMSYLQYFMKVSPLTQQDTEGMKAFLETQKIEAQKRAIRNFIFGNDAFAQAETQMKHLDIHRNEEQVNPSTPTESSEDPRRAMLNKIFGNNGMHV